MKYFICSLVFLKLTWAHDFQDIITSHITEKKSVGIITYTYEDQQEETLEAGVSQLGYPYPLVEDSIFEIGSITKALTGILLASFVIEKRIRLEDELALYLPEFKNSEIGEITIKELATHTSGLPFSPLKKGESYHNYHYYKLVNYLKNYSLPAHPTNFNWDNYSNTGIGLLGILLQRVGKRSFFELLYSRILNPLKMYDTSVELGLEQRFRFVKAYNQQFQIMPPSYFGLLVAAGGVHSSIRDMKKLLHALIYPQDDLLGQSIRFATRQHVGNANEGIGLAWAITSTLYGEVVGHSGSTSGHRGYIGFNRRLKKGYISFSNTAFVPRCLWENFFLAKACDFNF